MDHWKSLILGDEGGVFTVPATATIACKSSVFLDNWSRLARQLRVEETDITELKRDYSTERKTFEDLIVRLLEKWQGKEGSNATLLTLCNAFESIGNKDIAEKLKDEFTKRLAATTPATQEAAVPPAAPKVPVTESQLFHAVSASVHLWANELREDEVTQLARTLKAKLGLEGMSLGQLNQRGISQRDRVDKLLLIIESQCKGDIGKLLAVHALMTLGHPLEELSREIRWDLRLEYPSFLEFYESKKHTVE